MENTIQTRQRPEPMRTQAQTGLPAWVFEPYSLDVSAPQRRIQRLAIRMLARRAEAARLVN